MKESTTFENKMNILSDLVEDVSLAYSWEQLLDIDDIIESIDNADREKIDKHFQSFLSSIDVPDRGFDSYDYIISNVFALGSQSSD